KGRFFNVFRFDIAVTTRQHNGLVVAATLAVESVFKGTEIAADIGTTKFVIEGSATNGAFEHDVQRRDYAARLAVVLLPGLDKVGNLKVGYGKAREAYLGLGTTTHGALVADLTASTRACARKRGNRRRVVMGFHLHQHMHRLPVVAVGTGLAIGIKATSLGACDNSSVIGIGREHIVARLFIGIFDHLKQAERLRS